MRAGRWIALLLIVLLSGLFAFFNAGERTTLNLGFTVFYQVSLVRLVLGTFVLGMITMFLVGLRQDLRLRRQLREHGLLGPRPRGVRPPPPRPEPDATRWTSSVSTPTSSEPD